jgi:fused signal recognition particle receptor
VDRWHTLLASGSPETSLLIAVIVAVVLTAVLVLLMWRRARRARAQSTPLSARVGTDVQPIGLGHGLAKTRAGVLQRLLPLLGRDHLDADAVAAMEAALLAADVGVRMTERLVETVEGKKHPATASLRERFESELLAILQTPRDAQTPVDEHAVGGVQPRVVMVVGVNGVGKTTTIGKLAARFVRCGQRVLLVAGDTFRAAAVEQLAIWAERTGADLVRHQHGADPGAVAYDGIRAAIARGVDVVIVDTAGRLHTKSNLMDELRKVRRVIARELPGAPHETLLVIDAVTGQNGLAQGRAFLEQVDVTGVVLTKLDGTAKGGIAVAIAGELGIPIRFVGVGEGVGDLQEFSAEEFVAGLLEGVEPGGFA